MITTIFIIFGIALALLLLWAGFIYVTGDNDTQAAMSLVLFFGAVIIAKIAVIVVAISALIWFFRFVIGLL